VLGAARVEASGFTRLDLHFGQDFLLSFMSTSPSVKHLVRPRRRRALRTIRSAATSGARHVVSVAGDRLPVRATHKVVEDGFVRLVSTSV